MAVVLSARCTDAAVARVAPGLFARFPDAAAFARARPAEVGARIRSLGLWRSKARSLVAAARFVVRAHGGRVPRRLDDLVRLPGVGRKTANVVLGNAFGLAEGIAVDTHAFRLARRLGWTTAETPAAVERDLVRLFPRRRWTMLTHLLIAHGRAVCRPRRPRCGACLLAPLCPSAAPDRITG